MVMTRPLVLAAAAWLMPGSLAVRPENSKILVELVQAAKADSVGPQSAEVSAGDATQGSPPTATAAGVAEVGIANSTGLDTMMPGWAMRVLTFPLAMNPGVVLSTAALDMGAQLANFGPLPTSTSYPSKSSVLLESLATVADCSSDPLGVCQLMQTMVIIWFILLVVGITLLSSHCLWICCHKSYVNNQRPPFPDNVPDEVSMADHPHGFHNGIFSCFSSGSTVMYALCCPWVRHADTLSAAGVMNYWIVIFAFFISGAIAEFANGFARSFGVVIEHEIAHLVVLCLLFVPARQKLRAKFGSPETSTVTILKDFLFWFFLTPCSLAQEGMEVDQAEGVEVRCPCRLYDTSTGELVGAAVKDAEDD